MRNKLMIIAGLMLFAAGLYGYLQSVDSKEEEEVLFVPLHTYHISPDGDDENAGTSPDLAWRTPRHNTKCGDVIIVTPGNYPEWSWGKVSGCPSTSVGIDGTGGIYAVTLLCNSTSTGVCFITKHIEVPCFVNLIGFRLKDIPDVSDDCKDEVIDAK